MLKLLFPFLSLIYQTRRKGGKAMTKEDFSFRVQSKRKELYLMAFSVVRNVEDAKDAVSEAVATAWENLSRLKDESRFDAWLVKILYNVSKDMYDKNRQYADLKELSESFTSYADPGNIEFFDIISKCGLDGKTRQILILRFVYEYQLEEIAHGMGLPLSTVKTKYYRALKKLKNTEGIK